MAGIRTVAIITLALTSAGCAQSPGLTAARGVQTVATDQPAFPDPTGDRGSRAWSEADVAAQAQALRALFEQEVPDRLPTEQGISVAARVAAMNPYLPGSGPQALVAVDRAPQAQTAWILVAVPNGAWIVIGGTHVSTGRPGRKEHYRTPVGIFLNDGSILGYRAEGTFNENHVRGLGLKGMRVWDFGWQSTDDWRTPGATMQIRLEMHATDPANLAHRIGRPDSEGCIRIPASLNSFLDTHGVIDAALTLAKPDHPGIAQLISRQRDVTPLAGSAVVVYDSSDWTTNVAEGPKISVQ